MPLHTLEIGQKAKGKVKRQKGIGQMSKERLITNWESDKLMFWNVHVNLQRYISFDSCNDARIWVGSDKKYAEEAQIICAQTEKNGWIYIAGYFQFCEAKKNGKQVKRSKQRALVQKMENMCSRSKEWP